MTALRTVGSGLVVVLLVACMPAPAPDAAAIEPVSLPALPGSLGPKLAATPRKGLVLSWLEPADSGYALRHTSRQNEGWAGQRTVALGTDWFVNWADFPSVVPISDTLWAAHWLVRRPAGGYAYDIFATLSDDAGETWSGPWRLHDDGTDTEHGFVSIYPRDGGAGFVWLDGRGMAEPADDTSAGMTLRAGTLQADGSVADAAQIDGLVCDCCQTDVTVTPDGPVAVYRDRTTDETRDIYVSRHANGRWQQGRAVANDGWTIPGCPVNGPVVASHGNELAVAWFTNADDVARVRLARSADGAKTFASPVDVTSGGTAGRVGLVLADDGTAIVSWLRPAGDGTADVMLTPVTADGVVGEHLRAAGNVTIFSVPQLARDGDGVLLVYTEARDGSTALGAVHVPLSLLTG